MLGGGPAGCASALALKQVRPELRVLLVTESSSSNETWRIGETLAPGGRRILEGLGCWEAVRATGALEAYGSAAAWGSRDVRENEFLFSLRGNAWRLDRAAFDQALLSAVEASGTEVRRGSRLGAEDMDDLADTIIIDATGRSAAFASRRGAERVYDDHLVAVAARCEIAANDTRRGYTLVEAREHGWWYSTSVPGSRMVIAFMSDADIVRTQGLRDMQRWLKALEQTTHTKHRIAPDTRQEPLRLWAASSQRLRRVTGDRWIAVGDAASCFDPLSSAGIVKALVGGKLGAFAALDLLGGNAAGMRRYEAYVEREYAAYLETRATVYGEVGRWGGALFWGRRGCV